MQQGKCQFCGASSEGELFDKWVRPTFTNYDKLKQGNIACKDCLFWFDEASHLLAKRVGKWWPTWDSCLAANSERLAKYQKKSKNIPSPSDLGISQFEGGFCVPQVMRNYSHFIKAGEWIPLSKAYKREMLRLLITPPFPELAVIADSGQKHMVFRAKRNEAGGAQGWVQFEEHGLWLEPMKLKALLDLIEPALQIFSKAEIASGAYSQQRILQYGLSSFIALENKLKLHRGSLLFNLAIFLGQREEKNGTGSNETNGGGLDLVGMAGGANGLQEEVRAHDLGAGRKQRERGGDNNQQSRQVHQLTLL